MITNTHTHTHVVQVGTKWTGAFWQGYFQSPLSITSGFAEMWLLEYLNGIPNYAFGALSIEEIRDLYQVRVEMMSLGTDPWKVSSFPPSHAHPLL